MREHPGVLDAPKKAQPPFKVLAFRTGMSVIVDSLGVNWSGWIFDRRDVALRDFLVEKWNGANA